MEVSFGKHSMMKDSLAVCLTVDVEEDCPPYLNTFRGIEEGMDQVLALFAGESVKATFFVTGQVAEAYPNVIRKLVSMGHELGSHGLSHQPFDAMDPVAAAHDLCRSKEILDPFSPVGAFRAPNLRFPDAYVRLLADTGYRIDSSQAKYKLAYYHKHPITAVKRIPVSMTSSVLRLPDWIRFPVLKNLSSPVVLFVHPWEFVDLTQERLRLDCRFRTGIAAVTCLKAVIRFFKEKKARFMTIGALAMTGDKGDSPVPAPHHQSPDRKKQAQS